MIVPLDPHYTTTYTHKSELDADGKPKPGATVVHLRMATPRQSLILADRSARLRTDDVDDERALEIRGGLTSLLRMKFAITSIDNYATAMAVEADEFDPDSGRKLPTDEWIATFPDDFASGLVEKIVKMRELSKDEVGKSEGQSGQRSIPAPAETAAPATP